MKNLLHFILMLLLLAAFGVGCSRGGGEAGLVAIDSLIAASPDSALAALGRIDTAALGEGDRAYHALLTIRAQDKCGICMPHDSTLAAVAWDYYRQHPFDNRTVRAMLSKAVTDERLGHIQDAMRWYKHVELQARQQHDTVMMNYALMSMAALYQSHYHPKEAKQKYLQVLPQLAHNTDSWLFCAFSLARIYATEHSDSCLIWSRAIERKAAETGNRLYGALARRPLAAYYYQLDDYTNCVSAATQIINRHHEAATPDLYYYSVLSFAELGRADSALSYYQMLPQPTILSDSIWHLYAQAAIHKIRGDSQWAYELLNKADSIAGEELTRGLDCSLQLAESSAVLEVSNQKNHRVMWIEGGIIAVLLIGVGCLLFWRRHKRKKEKAAMEGFINENSREKDNLANELNALKSELVQQRKLVATLNDMNSAMTLALLKSGQQSLSNEWLMAALTEKAELITQHREQMKSANKAVAIALDALITNMREQIDSLNSTLSQAQHDNQKLREDIDMSNVEKKDHERQRNELETSIRELQGDLNDALEAQRSSMQQLQERKIESERLEESIACLCNVLSSIIEQYENTFKTSGHSKEKLTQLAMNEKFFEQLRIYVNHAHHSLADDMARHPDITPSDIDIICLHLCHMPNAIVRIYANVTREHTITNRKKQIAQKFFGPKGSTKDFENY